MTTIFRLVLTVAASLLASVAWAQEEDWQSLFDGRTFMGWQANAENPTSFEIEDGAITRCHLYYVGEVNGGVFRDFESKAKVKTLPNSNSGVYFHSQFQQEGWPDTGYEYQVNNSHGFLTQIVLWG